MSILLIGNSGLKANLKDGQTLKLRLYKKKIVDEGYSASFIDLENFLHHPFSILSKIKKELKICDKVVLISGERACKLLIPFINKHNKRKIPFVLPIVGSGVLHFSIDHLSKEDQLSFMIDGNYQLGKENKKIEKELKKIDFILPETELLKKVYSEYYHLDNCYVLNNFRDYEERKDFHHIVNEPIRLIFLSRVMRLKGIFELMDAIKDLNKEKTICKLDIYGDIDMSEEDKLLLTKILDDNITYKGSIDNNEVIDTISEYDLFVFPTNAVYEGTPGVIVESLIAGVPVLSSNFPQAKYLLKDGYDSILYEMFSKDDLKEKIIYCLNNRVLLQNMRKNALESGNKYLYKHEREKFLKSICGK